MLANRFVEVKDAENKLMCKIDIKKSREISNKDKAGKVLEYSLNVNLNLEALSTLDGSSVFKKNYSQIRNTTIYLLLMVFLIKKNLIYLKVSLLKIPQILIN